MDRDEASVVVNGALTRLIETHPELLDLDASERALTHHLANYIQERVSPGLRVDVEYNRHGADPKRLHLNGRRGGPVRLVRVFPDVIIHKRGTDEFNLVVLEVKKPHEDLQYDDEKLHAFRAELRYQHAGHVIIGLDKDGTLVQQLIWI